MCERVLVIFVAINIYIHCERVLTRQQQRSLSIHLISTACSYLHPNFIRLGRYVANVCFASFLVLVLVVFFLFSLVKFI